MKLLGILLCGVFTAAAQPADPPATFDVASIKTSQNNRPGGGGPFQNNIQATPGSLTIRNVTLKAAVAWAYHVFEYQVSGPDMLESGRYDIVAKAAGPANEPQLRLMLQTLLADRFKVVLHRQTKEMSAYILQVGKSGPKFQESKSEGESNVQPDQKTMSIAVQRMPISQLVDILSKLFQTPIIDMTGLGGRYDVTIDVAKYLVQSGEKPDVLSMIQTGLQQELGLRLESRKTPVELVIVDRAEKVPVEN